MRTRNRTQDYVWHKVAGREIWNLFGTVRNAFDIAISRRVGRIRYSGVRNEYRYFPAMFIVYNQGYPEDLERSVADKLKEVNSKYL